VADTFKSIADEMKINVLYLPAWIEASSIANREWCVVCTTACRNVNCTNWHTTNRSLYDPFETEQKQLLRHRPIQTQIRQNKMGTSCYSGTSKYFTMSSILKCFTGILLVFYQFYFLGSTHFQARIFASNFSNKIQTQTQIQTQADI
jgi:hypothetical protein